MSNTRTNFYCDSLWSVVYAPLVQGYLYVYLYVFLCIFAKRDTWSNTDLEDMKTNVPTNDTTWNRAETKAHDCIV